MLGSRACRQTSGDRSPFAAQRGQNSPLYPGDGGVTNSSGGRGAGRGAGNVKSLASASSSEVPDRKQYFLKVVYANS